MVWIDALALFARRHLEYAEISEFDALSVLKSFCDYVKRFLDNRENSVLC